MEQLINSFGNSILLFLILWITFIILIIYIIWSLLKSAITKGVQDGIYNAIILLQNNGIITDIINETEETKNIFDPNNPPT